MEKILRLFDPRDVDPVTIDELKHFAERKYDEQLKLKGQIARDLSRIGEYAFQNPAAYDKLRAKYKAHWASKKKIAILDMMKKEWCKKIS